MNTTRVMFVHENADGYWYIGAGRSIAEGPYRYPQQVLTVASDLLSTEPHWRIEVFDLTGNPLISYSSEDVAAGDLNLLPRQRQWRHLDVNRIANQSHLGEKA